MTPRALWKGRLVGPDFECGVGLYSALSSAEKISFHIVNRKTGHRVERRYIDSETEEPVERDHQVRGFRLDDGDYVLVEDEALKKLTPESHKTITIRKFLPCDEVDKLFFDKPYYLAPVADADKSAFRMLGDVLDKSGTTAFAETVLFRRNRALLIRAHEGSLIATTLSYDYEVRSLRNAFKSLPEQDYDQELVELAGHIIETKTSRFDPSDYHDRYNAALAELVQAKLEGRKIEPPKPRRESKVVDLREALRRSAADSGTGKRRSGAAGRARKAG